MLNFRKKTTYYPFPVYEFNLPAGWSCPFADGCKVKVDRETGKQDIIGKQYRCYASASERFPIVRQNRWSNYEKVLSGDEILIPKDASYIRIHGSGDFYSQEYFDRWLECAEKNPDVRFWAFTKSIGYWVNRIDRIPKNFVLTASYGSLQDDLIEKHGLRSAKVYDFIEDVPAGLKIDTDDSLSMKHGDSFALLNNFKKKRVKND